MPKTLPASVKSTAKKAAKKSAAKKHAKKAAKKHAGHGHGHDLRRAFEHISRVRILHLGMQPAALAQVDTLARLAQGALLADDPRSAADLLRAAEHIAFGSMATTNATDAPSRALTEAAREEYEALLERGKDHLNHREKPLAPDLRSIHKAMLASAAEAYKAGALHRALEFARGAEALTHTNIGAIPKNFPPPPARRTCFSDNPHDQHWDTHIHSSTPAAKPCALISYTKPLYLHGFARLPHDPHLVFSLSLNPPCAKQGKPITQLPRLVPYSYPSSSAQAGFGNSVPLQPRVSCVWAQLIHSSTHND